MKHRLVLNSLLGVNDLYVDMSKQMIIHYSKYPISEFVLTLNGNESQIRRFRDFLRGINVRMRIFPNTLVYDNRRQARWSNQRQAYIRDRYSEHDWKISVDSDEILLMNDVLYDTLDCTDSSYFLAFTVDMMPERSHVEVPCNTTVFEIPHRKCFLTQTNALAQKAPLARNYILVEGAAHNVTKRFRREKRFEKILPLYHYKWESGVRERMLERFNRYKRLAIPYYNESRKFYDILQDGINQLVVEDIYSVRFNIKRDKTGECSLRIDPRGEYEFYKY